MWKAVRWCAAATAAKNMCFPAMANDSGNKKKPRVNLSCKQIFKVMLLQTAYKLTGTLVSISIWCSAFAQTQWQSMDHLFAPLPAGFHVFKTTDTLGGRPNIAWYAEVDLNQHHLTCAANTTPDGKRHTPSAYYDSILAQPLLVVNGTFFSFADNRNLNIVVDAGKIKAYNVTAVPTTPNGYHYVTRSAIGIDRRGRADVAWVFTDSTKPYAYQFSAPSVAKGPSSKPAIKDVLAQMPGTKARRWSVKTAIGGGPMLVQAGKINITNQQEHMFVTGLRDKHPRTIMGYTAQNNLIVMAIEGRHPGTAEGATLAQAAQLLVELGCVEGLNLDGGGSSCMLIKGKPTITVSDKEGQRPVPAVFSVRSK
ncbi:MAG: phosphodiester glycosidase family protein [Bacteroidetes bacterium]|nr:MAG: phosphodiester glycosidase family protein [Bacteroidota bacterium]